MSDFEEKDAITNAAFDQFLVDQKMMVADEATREIFFQVFIGGMQFMMQQIAKEMGITA